MEFPRPRGENISGFVASFGISSALKAGEKIIDLPKTGRARQNSDVAHSVGNIPYNITRKDGKPSVTFSQGFIIDKLILYEIR